MGLGAVNLFDAASFLSQQWPVFACNGDKRPLTAHGLKDATTDLGTLRDMFRRPGAAMIGVPTGEASGFVVVDLDIKEGASGLEWLAANEHRLPRTRRHRTRSGGLHLLFITPPGRTIRNSASKIAPGVDIRGQGGYVIVPPSPGYSIADDAMPAEMPDWLVEVLDPPAPPAAEPVRQAVRRDDDTNGSRYGLRALEDECTAVMNAPFGQQEVTLNNAGLKLGALVAGGELAHGYALSMLHSAARGMPSQGGKPAWGSEELHRKVERAFTDGTARPRQAPPREVRHTVRVEMVVPPEPPPYEEPPEHWQAEAMPMEMDAAERPARPRQAQHAPFPTLSLDEIAALPPPEWLVHKILPVNSFATLIGPFASLKSFLALDMSLCIAYGVEWKNRSVKQTGVLYVAGEGVGGIGRRIAAWRSVQGLEDVPAPFRLLPVGVNITDDGEIQRLVLTAKAAAEAEGQPIGLVIIDTLARAMAGADENTAQDMGRAIRGLDEVRVDGACTTLTVHHMGKDKERGSRGSSALPGAADTEITVEREESTLTVRVTKQKEDDEGEPIILQARKVGLDGQEPVEGEPTSLVLVAADGEGAQSSSRRPSGQLSGDQHQALKVLNDALAEHGEHGHSGCPAGHVSIPETWWRDRFYDRCKPGADQATKQKAFRRAADALVRFGSVANNRGRVWAI